MSKSRETFNFVVCLVSILISGVAHAEESNFEIGLRGNVLLGDGVPANDILGYGVISRYRLNNGWFIGAGIDTYAFDYERPWKLVGLVQDPGVPTIDASAENTVFNGSYGTSYNFSERWSTSFAARLEHHFMDVLITDTVSGNITQIDSQSPLGAYLSLNYRF